MLTTFKVIVRENCHRCLVHGGISEILDQSSCSETGLFVFF